MTSTLEPYAPAIVALGLLGGLHLVQLLVADAVAIARKHVPGTPIVGGHDDLLFRVARAHANTAESIGAVILISGFAIAVQAAPSLVNGALAAFLACRALHTIAYYADLRIVRSVAFALATLALLVLLATGLASL